MRASWWPKPTRQSAIQDSTMAMNRNVVVITSAPREPSAGGLDRLVIVPVVPRGASRG